MRSLTLSLLAAGLLASPQSASAQTDASQCKRKTAGFYLEYADLAQPKIAVTKTPGIAVSLTGNPGDAKSGRDILIGKKKGDCLSCHRLAMAGAPKQGEVGPALDTVGRRYTEAQLRQIVVNPKVFFPETIMPSYFNPNGGAGALLTGAEVEDVVAYMKGLK
jgi:sulfur-oxidizing protein SoxX